MNIIIKLVSPLQWTLLPSSRYIYIYIYIYIFFLYIIGSWKGRLSVGTTDSQLAIYISRCKIVYWNKKGVKNAHACSGNCFEMACDVQRIQSSKSWIPCRNYPWKLHPAYTRSFFWSPYSSFWFDRRIPFPCPCFFRVAIFLCTNSIPL